MQKKEVIIDQFIKTIKDSPAEVNGDPMILTKVFDALDKKKRRRGFFALMSFISVVLVGIGVGIYYYQFAGLDKNLTDKISTKKLMSTSETSADLMGKIADNRTDALNEVNNPVKPVATKKKLTNMVSYKFSNHKIDVLKDNSDAFIQINVFGVDGAEKDFLKVVEELKNSYRSNELIVDSVKQK